MHVYRGLSPEWKRYAWSDNVEGTNQMKKYYPDIHRSEWDWVGSEIDYGIDNDHDLEYLDMRVKDMLDFFDAHR